MRVLAYYSHNDIREEEWPKPDPGLGEVRVAIKSVGICGSDITHYKKGSIGNLKVNQGFIFGHEAAGMIDAVGEGVTGLPEGTVVAVEPAIACQKCKYCLQGQQNICPNHSFLGVPPTNGALAEYIIVPAQNVVSVNAKVSFAEIAMLEPLGIGLHTANLLAIKAGESVAIIGAGGIGIAALIAAKLNGARVIAVLDRVESRLKVAAHYGAENTLNCDRGNVEEEINKLTAGRGVDHVIEAAGEVVALEMACKIAAPGAKVAIIGIPVDDQWQYPAAKARRKELVFFNVRRSNHTLELAVDLVERGQVNLAAMVTHKLAWTEVEKAFGMAESRAEGTLRVVLEPQEYAEPFYN